MCIELKAQEKGLQSYRWRVGEQRVPRDTLVRVVPEPEFLIRKSLLARAIERIGHAEVQLLAAVLRLLGKATLVFLVLILALYFTFSMSPFLGKIPLEIQLFCGALVVFAAGLMIRMLAERRRASQAMDQFVTAIASVPPASREERMYGLDDVRIDDIYRRAEALTGSPREWWQSLEETLEFYTGPDGRAGWFLTRPVAETLPEHALITPFYHSSFHQAVPAILTALGLLGTFTAILLALSGVSYNAADAARPVTGIDGLINGLAGKFLSSIVALLASLIFTFVEKKACERSFEHRHAALVQRIGKLFPLLTQTRILLDIQRSLVPSWLLERAAGEERR